MSDAQLHVEPLTAALGAEVTGVDLSTIDGETWEELYGLWKKYMVLFFPGQDLDADGHLEFARRFGTPEIHPYLDKYDESHPEIVVLTSEGGNAADIWHTDVTFQEVPPKASVLKLAAVPALGGDTMWMNQCLAYEALSAPMRDLLDGLTAVHTAKGYGEPETQHEHPAVIVHPETGRRALYVNRSFTSHFVQMRPAESDALLEFLFSWCSRPEFQCRYRWTQGAVGVWDNRCTQHYAVKDYSEFRRLERVTIEGDRPPSGSAARWEAYEGPAVEHYRSRSHVNPPSPSIVVAGSRS